MIGILKGTRPGRIAVAAWALGYLRDARAVPALISTLHQGAPAVKPDVAWALGEICDREPSARSALPCGKGISLCGLLLLPPWRNLPGNTRTRIVSSR